MLQNSKIALVTSSLPRTSALHNLLCDRGADVTLASWAADRHKAAETDNLDVVVLDCRDQSVPVENVDTLYRAISPASKIVLLSDETAPLPESVHKDLERCQVLTGLNADQEVLSCMDMWTRLDTLSRELDRRKVVSKIRGAPFDPEEKRPRKQEAAVLLLARPSVDYGLIETSVASSNTVLVSAFTPESALSYLERQLFDLLIIDCVEDGSVEFAKSIRNDPRWQDTPVLLLLDGDKNVDGETHDVDAQCNVMVKPLNEHTLYRQSRAYICESQYRRQLKELSFSQRAPLTCDVLSELYNFGFLMDHLKEQVADAEKTKQPFSVALFDIFKLADINTEFGYGVGDSVLRQTGRVIGHMFRGEDLCARSGGDEFAVVLPGTDLSFTRTLVRRIARTINALGLTVPDSDEPLKYFVNAGYCAYEGGDTPESLLQRAKQVAGTRG